MRQRSLAIRTLVLVCFAGVSVRAAPIGTSFTYQGQLRQNGAPANGTIAMEFRLFDAATTPPGVQIGSTINLSVNVVNGLFTVILNQSGQFGANPFDGNERHLDIRVGGLALTPRQRLTVAPYAQTAVSALTVPGIDGHSLNAADGSPLDAVFVDNVGNVGVGITTPDTMLHVHRSSAGAVTANAESVAVLERAGNAYLSILTPNASERGVLFGQQSDNAAGGIIYNNPATSNGLQFRTAGNVTRMVINSQGSVGIGTTNPAAPLELAFGARSLQFRNDGGLVPGLNLTGTSGNLGILRIRNKIEMFPNDAGTTAASIDVRAANGAVNILLDGAAGNIDANGAVRVDGANTNIGTTAGGVLRFGGGGSGELIASKRNAGGNQYGIDFYTGHNNRLAITNTGNVGIGTTTPAARLDVNGRTRTKSLEIVGGADLAEAFEIRKATCANPNGDPNESIEPGTVVVIDPDNPGSLKVSEQAADPKVAGVVSGAKGLAPGMVLRAENTPHVDGATLVAMTGRVWCLCDAEFGAIAPGDLLTTSRTPGHAMRVADDAAIPRGAIIGKAMTPLAGGRGLVLVLVNLQ